METKTDTNITGKKRVLVFIPRFPVRTERFIEREVSKLAENKDMDVTVVAMGRGDIEVPESLKDRVFYRRLTIKECFNALNLLFKKLDVVLRLFPIFIFKPYTFLKAVGYAQMLAEFKPNIIYSHFMSKPSTLSLIVAQLLGIEFAISAHARDIFVNPEYIKEKVKYAKFISICNKNAWEYVREKSGIKDPQNIKLIYHGLNFMDLTNPEVLGVSRELKGNNIPVLFTNGRFEEKKGHQYLLEASKILNVRGIKHLVYILGGGGSLYIPLLNKIKELRMEDTVKIIGDGKGLADFNDVAAYYKSSDIFVFPSIQTEGRDVDGVANVLIEAAAFGLPIVATDAGSTCDLIENEKTGLVVEQRNAVQLADAIERLLNNVSLRVTLGNAAYAKAYAMFNLDENIGEIEHLLLE